MNQHEQQKADELEQAIQDAQAGKTPKQSQSELAQQLVTLAQQTEPSPAFVANLQAQLERQAKRKQKKGTVPKKQSFWHDFLQQLTGDKTMKRLIALGAILALILFGGAVLWQSGLLSSGTQTVEVTAMPVASIPESSESTETTTDETNTDTKTAVTVLPPSELPALPRFQGNSQAGGVGGGGGAAGAVPAGIPEASTTDGIVVDEMIVNDIDIRMMDPFSGTTFTLNTSLPTDAANGQVMQREGEAEISVDQARQIANRFGFTGPLYTESHFLDMPEMGPDGASTSSFAGPPTSYVAFDGAKTLRIDPWSINYSDEAAALKLDYENMTLPDNAIQIAEAFLQERGLLDFPYEIRDFGGFDLQVYRLMNGRSINEPEIIISLNEDGEVVYVFDSVVNEWTDLGTYPLIPAEQAWQQMQSGIFENGIQYWIMPGNMDEMIVEEGPAFADEYRYWPRTFTPGNEIHLYDWPQVYMPVDGGTPLLKVRQYTLVGDDATLTAMAEARDQQIHLWGTLNADNTISLAGWEPMAGYEPIFQQGVVRRVGDQLQFYGVDGDIYILPDAPADIENGLEVNVFGFNVRDLGLEYPVMDWESIDKYIDYAAEEPFIEEPLPVDSSTPAEPFVPFRYEGVTIDSAELSYMVTYFWPEEAMVGGDAFVERVSPTIVLQPAWTFSGTAVNGDEITFFVQAVDEAYLQQP